METDVTTEKIVAARPALAAAVRPLFAAAVAELQPAAATAARVANEMYRPNAEDAARAVFAVSYESPEAVAAKAEMVRALLAAGVQRREVARLAAVSEQRLDEFESQATAREMPPMPLPLMSRTAGLRKRAAENLTVLIPRLAEAAKASRGRVLATVQRMQEEPDYQPTVAEAAAILAERRSHPEPLFDVVTDILATLKMAGVKSAALAEIACTNTVNVEARMSTRPVARVLRASDLVRAPVVGAGDVTLWRAVAG